MKMTKDEKIRSQLMEIFAHIEAYINLSNAAHMFNVNTTCEDIFKTVLNLAYGYSLINLNDVEYNYPAIDLADSGKGICFQVTSNDSNRKVANTIKRFKHADRARFKNLYFLFLKSNKGKSRNKEEIIDGVHVCYLYLSNLIEDILEIECDDVKYKILNHLDKQISVIERVNKRLSYIKTAHLSDKMTIPIIDIFNSILYIHQFDSLCDTDCICYHYGNLIDYSEGNEEKFIVSLSLENSGYFPINQIAIEEINISSIVSEVYEDSYGYEPFSQNSNTKTLNCVINAGRRFDLNVMLCRTNEEYTDSIDCTDQFIFDITILVKSSFSDSFNKYSFEVFATKEGAEEIVGMYNIDAIRVNNVIINESK